MAAGRVKCQSGIIKQSVVNAAWGRQVIGSKTPFVIISSLLYCSGGWLWFYQEMVSPSFPGLWLAETISAIQTFILLAQNFKWTRVHMMTSSNGKIFRVTGPLCGEFTGPGEFPTQRPVTRSFDVFFDLRLNKRLSKQRWGWWFETPSWSLWRQCNEKFQPVTTWFQHTLLLVQI